MKRHLAFLKAYRQVLRLKLNANEDLWVNGVKKPEDRGGCKHLFGKIDSNTIEAALLRGKLSENNKAITIPGGGRSVNPGRKIWVSYFQCLKETSPEVLLTAFEQSLTWIDFEQMSESKLKKLLVFLWEGFSGGTRLSLWMQLMGQKAFRAKAHSILEASSELDREMLQHMKTYDALWKKEPTLSWSDPETRAVLDNWLSIEKINRGTLPKVTRLRLWRILLNSASSLMLNHQWLGANAKGLADNKFTDGLWALSRRALLWSHYDRAALILSQIPSEDRTSQEAQYLLRMLKKPRIGPYALMNEVVEDSYRGEAFWLTRGLKTFLQVTGMTEGKKILAERKTLTHVDGLSQLIDGGGFEQGAFCITSLVQGQPLPRFLKRAPPKQRARSLFLG